MNPEPSVGMSAKNSVFIVEEEQVPAGSTTLTVAPSPPGAPVGGLTNDSPPAVTVTVIRTGTPVCVSPVSGFVQLVVPSHCIDELVNDVKLSVCRVESRPAPGNALDDVPFEGVMRGLQQVVPGTRCAGRAVTVRQITGQRGDFGSEDFKVGDMIEAAASGNILVIDNAGHCVSTFGGLATLAAKTKASVSHQKHASSGPTAPSAMTRKPSTNGPPGGGGDSR